MSPIPGYFHLWAKTDRSTRDRTHPLIYHLLDVGQCALALWQSALSEQTKNTLAGNLGLDPETAGRLLAFWAALHDLGKAAPGFQRKYAPRIPILQREGFIFPPDSSPNPAPHGILTTWALKDLLVRETGLSIPDARQIAYALGGHHGAWPTSDRFSAVSLKSTDKGGPGWDTARLALFQAVLAVYQPAPFSGLPKDQRTLNSFLTIFSGLVSVADWIGSMSDFFPYEEAYRPAGDYAARVTRQAQDTLTRLGWLGWHADGRQLSFAAMFPELLTPNPIQEQSIAFAQGSDLPALLILEAPPGIGKTEVALFLADRWLQRQRGAGLYVAMPTQATSNQMFGRVVKFLENRYPSQSINAHLVHGAALLTAASEEYKPQAIGQDEETTGTVKAGTWFLPRKRTLLAPFGVGTVDQALLAVLQTRHFFVRMLGMGHKIVIFDEIHAYDTYMTTLFKRLLGWLRSTGASVILLSATLPANTRRDLATAWLGPEHPDFQDCAYPRLTIAGGDRILTRSLPSPPPHSLGITWIDPEPVQIAAHLDEKLKNGGCAAVICNRVARAQEVYTAILEMGIVEPVNLILFHARFPFLWRKEIEERVLAWFSKTGARPRKAIVVATQVIEQSLDLDFDTLVTDLAPVDLLLQRAGRLHRHARNQATRPEALRQPGLAIASRPGPDGLPDIGADAWVYAPATLLRTWHCLRGRGELTLPDETPALIEAVYDGREVENTDPAFVQALAAAEEDLRQKHEKENSEAIRRLIATPDDEELVGARNEALEEDNPEVHEAFRALTRLGEPSVPLVCLWRTPAGETILEPGGKPVELGKRPNREQVVELLEHTVSVQRREVVAHFTGRVRVPSAWRQTAALHDHYPVIFDSSGEFHPAESGFFLKLTRELGLEIYKEAK